MLAAGSFEWIRQVGFFGDGGAFEDSAGAAELDGNLYIVGTSDGVLSGDSPVGASDVYVRKYDAAGYELWTRAFGSNGFDFGLAIAVGAAGVYVAGSTEIALPGQSSAGAADAFVRKYDFDGQEPWTRQFGSDDADFGTGVALFEGRVYVVGYTFGALPGLDALGGFDAFLRAYDADGNDLWTRQFGASVSDDLTAGATYGALPGQGFQGNADLFLARLAVVGLDYGDAPDTFLSVPGSYPTLLANDGARHVMVSGFSLGAAPDAEADGQPDEFAAGDDVTLDDEAGVHFVTVLNPGANATLEVTLTNTAALADPRLNARFDWNQDGDWNDAGEHAINDASLNGGPNTVLLAVPADALPGATFARFRLNDGGGLTPQGLADEGEVEDYAVNIVGPGPTTPDDSDDATNQVVEGAAAGDSTGLTAASTIEGGGSVTFSLLEDAGGRFQIDASTGVVRVGPNAAGIDFETATSQSITVRATDGGTGQTDATFTIQVLNGEATLADANADANTVPADAAAGVAAQITAQLSDPNTPASGVTYSLSDNAGGRFQIDGSTGVVSVAAGAALVAGGSHSITVLATYGSGQTSQSFTISVSAPASGNAPPTVDLNGAAEGVDFVTAAYTGAADVAIMAADAVFADVDAGDQLVSALVRVTDHFQAGDTLTWNAVLATSLGIAGSYNALSGELDFSGSATPDAYAQVLRSAQFRSTAPLLDSTDRTLQVTVNDGDSTSVAAKATVVMPPRVVRLAWSDPASIFRQFLAFDPGAATRLRALGAFFHAVDAVFSEEVSGLTAADLRLNGSRVASSVLYPAGPRTARWRLAARLLIGALSQLSLGGSSIVDNDGGPASGLS